MVLGLCLFYLSLLLDILYLSFCLNVFNKHYIPYDQSFEYDDFLICYMREHYGCKLKKIMVDKHHYMSQPLGQIIEHLMN